MNRICLFLALTMSTAALAENKKKAPAPAAPAKGEMKMDPKMAAMMEAWQKAMTVGEEHKKLKAWLDGEWTAEAKMWMGPGEPQKATGSAKYSSILGDRFIEETYSGQMMGKPFEGRNHIGFDNVSKKFVSSWIDSMGTGITTSEGTFDASGKVLTMTNSYNDAMTGKPATSRSVTTFESDKKHSMEMWEKGPDGKEMKVMEITYTKK